MVTTSLVLMSRTDFENGSAVWKSLVCALRSKSSALLAYVFNFLLNCALYLGLELCFLLQDGKVVLPSIFLKQELNCACEPKYLKVKVILICSLALIRRSISLKVRYTHIAISLSLWDKSLALGLQHQWITTKSKDQTHTDIDRHGECGMSEFQLNFSWCYYLY